jgi:hypothetical protein
MADAGAQDFPFAENLTNKCSHDLATFVKAVFSLRYENVGGNLRVCFPCDRDWFCG